MKLWELAEEFEKYSDEAREMNPDGWVAFGQCAGLLKKWAREKAKKIADLASTYPEDMVELMNCFLHELGVPEDK